MVLPEFPPRVLDGVERVGRVHLAEALSYRALADEMRRAA
jgi:magnesium chelatase family protein